MVSRALCVVVLTLMVVSVGLTAPESTQTFSVNWTDKPVSEALAALHTSFGINYVLPADLGAITVSANLMNVTPERALQAVVFRAGLTAENRDGTWVISRPAGASDGNTYAQFGEGRRGGWGGMGGMGGEGIGGMANPSGISLPTPGPSGTFGAVPGSTAAATTSTTTGTTTTTNQNFIVIPLFRSDPISIAVAFGGPDMVVEDMTSSAGSSSGSSSSGYGNNSYGNNNNNGYGNNNGNSRSSRNSNSNSSYGNSSSSRSNRSSRNSN